jgi:flagellar biosynthesis/type III secretory pathway protein FliH
MSTSPSQSRILSATTSPASETSPQALPFPYREIPASAGSSASAHRDLGQAGFEDDLAHEGAGDIALREARTRELGRQEGQIEASKNFELQLVRERTMLTTAVGEFIGERAAYYQKVEAEVVQLALNIARKILHREAQVDPLLLAGIARVALEKIEGATHVTLLVHPQVAAGWRQHLALTMKSGDIPEIVEDPALQPDRCKLQTSMGVAEIGIEVQLKEIEQGLTDLLAARPREKV